MPDSIQNENAAQPAAETSGQIAQLTSRMAALEQRISTLKEEAKREVLQAIVIQNGQNVTVSGGNGHWTISANVPTGGNGTGTLDCTQDPPVVNVSIALF